MRVLLLLAQNARNDMSHAMGCWRFPFAEGLWEAETQGLKFGAGLRWDSPALFGFVNLEGEGGGDGQSCEEVFVPRVCAAVG